MSSFRHKILHKALLALAGPVNRHHATLDSRRQRMEKLASWFRLPRGITTKSIKIGHISAEWLTPRDANPNGIILYLHGGGYVMGSIKTHRHLAGRIAKAAKTRTCIIDYRLAPEHPYPAAVEDALTSYRWLLGQNIDPACLVVAGDSAGGGLALALLLALRDAGEPLPAAGVYLSPWTDLAGTGKSLSAKAHVDPIVIPEGLHQVAKLYLNGIDPKTPLASPLYADLQGLPPLFIQVGTHEALLDDSLRLAERARQAGLEVTLDVWDEMMHVWQFFAFILPEGKKAIEEIGRFIRNITSIKKVA